MDIENSITPMTLSNQLVAFFFMMFIDVALSCGVIFCENYTDIISDSESINGGFKQEQALVFNVVASSLQVGLHLTFLFWYFFLVWKMFPFRFGLVKELIMKDAQVLLFVPLNCLLYFLERGVRLHYIQWTKQNNISTLYDNGVYMLVFWPRHLFLVFMMGWSIHTAIRLNNPVYYKPGKWLAATI